MSSQRNDLLGFPRGKKRVWIRYMKSNRASNVAIDEMTVRGLEVGRWYKVTLRVYCRVNNGSNIYLRADWADLFNPPNNLFPIINMEQAYYTGYNSMTNQRTEQGSRIIQAKTSVIRCSVTGAWGDGTALFAGSPGYYWTGIMVEELDQDLTVDQNY